MRKGLKNKGFMMKNDLERILLTEEEIAKRVQEMGKELAAKYEGKNPVFICILRGAVVFLADLLRSVAIPVEIDFFSLSSYGASTESSGVVKIRKDIDKDITNRSVIVIEDIVDSGLTLHYIKDYLQNHKPESIEICTLLDKPQAHQTDLKLDYVGFEISNEFVVGYGLDFAEKYRNLPYLAVLKKEMYT
jgi:hypoxanthine phosphoribosyltransferase